MKGNPRGLVRGRHDDSIDSPMVPKIIVYAAI